MKIVYFADEPFDETIIEEWEWRKQPLEDAEINLSDVTVTTDPRDFRDRDYDVLLFDWGGMSIGNSVLEMFSREIIELAEEHPSRSYVMMSHFSEWAMKEILEETKNPPANVYLTVEDFISAFQKGLVG